MSKLQHQPPVDHGSPATAATDGCVTVITEARRAIAAYNRGRGVGMIPFWLATIFSWLGFEETEVDR